MNMYDGAVGGCEVLARVAYGYIAKTSHITWKHACLGWWTHVVREERSPKTWRIASSHIATLAQWIAG